jgi:hypothetical protein
MGWGGGSEEEVASEGGGEGFVVRGMTRRSKKDSSQKTRWKTLPHFADSVRNDGLFLLRKRQRAVRRHAAEKRGPTLCKELKG